MIITGIRLLIGVPIRPPRTLSKVASAKARLAVERGPWRLLTNNSADCRYFADQFFDMRVRAVRLNQLLAASEPRRSKISPRMVVTFDDINDAYRDFMAHQSNRLGHSRLKFATTPNISLLACPRSENAPEATIRPACANPSFRSSENLNKHLPGTLPRGSH